MFLRKIILPLTLSIAIVCISSGGQEQISPGKIIYEKNCLSCHQADGTGVPGMNPPLSKVAWVTGNKEKLIHIILKGLSTPLEIDGELYHNPMPAHSHLTDKEIADVLSYIRSSFGNKATAVSSEEVKKVRMKK